MANHHLLWIHGIGNHGKTWVDDADEGGKSCSTVFNGLLDSYASVPAPSGVVVKHHSICYDDEILKLFASWADQAKKLKEGLATSPILLDEAAWFTETIDKATAAQTAANWQFTHLMDLLLFAGSPTIQDRLVTHVGRQILELVRQFPGEDFSLVGHSLGTSMAHKVIQAIFNEGIVDAQGVRQSLKGDFVFKVVVMIANCSYALSRDRPNHYTGIVRPSLKAGAGCCLKWINVNHRFDPVGRFMRFDYRKDPAWLDPKVDSRGFHRDIELSRISSQSIHSISHYLRDPGFHLPLFELALGKRFTQKQRDDALDEFADEAREAIFKSLRSHLETIDVSKTENFKEFYLALKSFLELVRQ